MNRKNLASFITSGKLKTQVIPSVLIGAFLFTSMLTENAGIQFGIILIGVAAYIALGFW